MLLLVFIEHILRFNLRAVIRLGVRLTGWFPDGVTLAPTSVGSTDGAPAPPPKPPMAAPNTRDAREHRVAG